MLQSIKKFFIRYRTVFILLFISAFIKGFSFEHSWVEHYYTYGLYPVIVQLLRKTLGWVPFSIGDVIYLCAFFLIVYTGLKVFRLFKRIGFTKKTLSVIIKKAVTLSLSIYIVFNILWGINYNRLGIASQLKLDVQPYTTEQLSVLTAVLQHRLNFYAAQIDTERRNQFNNNHILFKGAIEAYQQVAKPYSFLTYQSPSIKPSLYSSIGHFFGFTGYYNPFTGEAQVKTSVPVFLKPFIVTHEIAHQLGYAKENEANFVGYLASRTSNDISFRYSVYFELYWYAMSDLYYKTPKQDLISKVALHPQVFKDYQELRKYLFRTRNFIEPYISRFYNQYLKLNNQPEGLRTYNEVIAWLIAYQKRYGVESI